MKTYSKPFLVLIFCFFLGISLNVNADTPSPDSQAQTQIVNINTADAQTLAQKLKGIGIKKAEAIVAYRESFGLFTHIDELAEVKGIGKKTIEINSGAIEL